MYPLGASPVKGSHNKVAPLPQLRKCVLGSVFFIVFALAIGITSAAAQEVSPFARLIGVAAPDTRLLVLRLLQIIWAIGFGGGIGLGVYGFVLMRNAAAEQDSVSETRGKRLAILGGGIALAALILFGIISFIYAKIEGQYNAEKEFASSPIGLSAFSGEYQNKLSRVEDHYPERDEKNISRNAAIIITFRQAIDPHSISDENGKVISSSIRIYEISPHPTPEEQGRIALVRVSQDNKTVTLQPDPLLGEPEKKSLYGVILSSAIRLDTGDSLFGNTGGYAWQFEVSGSVDLTPPTVQSALPLAFAASSQGVAPNALVQITFNEPIDPGAVSGEKITIINKKTNSPISGLVRMGNNYQTLTFYPLEQCGKNTCSEDIFCLPKDADVEVVVKSAALAAQRTLENPHRAAYPYTGIVDTSGNSLDGGGEAAAGANGKSEGPPADNFQFTFHTGSQLQLTPPTIATVNPVRDAVRVDVNAPIQILFSTYMDSNSLHQGSIFLGNDINYSVASENDIRARGTRSTIQHDQFRVDTLYQPEIRSEAHDIYQNCFNPCLGPIP